MSQIYGLYEILGLNSNASNDDIKKVSKTSFLIILILFQLH